MFNLDHVIQRVGKKIVHGRISGNLKRSRKVLLRFFDEKFLHLLFCINGRIFVQFHDSLRRTDIFQQSFFFLNKDIIYIADLSLFDSVKSH